MLYILFNQGQVVGSTTESPWTGTPKLKEFPGITYDSAKSVGDFKNIVEVCDIAIALFHIDGKQWIAFDNGPGTSHQFGVMEAPQIGDEVSRGFNG